MIVCKCDSCDVKAEAGEEDMEEFETIRTMCELREKYDVRFRFEKEGMILTKVWAESVVPIKFNRLFSMELLEYWESDLENLVQIFCKEAECYKKRMESKG